MARDRLHPGDPHAAGGPSGLRIGAVLLELSNAIRRAERCRLALRSMGMSERRWQEIVKDVDPALRFMVRPQMLDAIITRLASAGEPVSRDVLVDELSEQGAGAQDRIRHAITANLRSRKLVLHPDNKIGLPPRRKKKRT